MPSVISCDTDLLFVCSIPATKQFLRKLGIAAVVRLGNTATLSFSDIAK